MMSPTATPIWLRDEAIGGEDVLPLKSSSVHLLGSSSGSSSGHIGAGGPLGGELPPAVVTEDMQRKKVMIQWALRVTTMLLCVLMLVTAAIGLGSITGVDKSGKIFVATYMFFFSSLLFVFEGIQFQTVEWIDHMLKRNFGFLYNAMGKAFFIIL
jgi:hypothetical protein